MDHPYVLGKHLQTETNNPDEQIVIDKDLLRDIRDHFAYDAWDKANTSSEILLEKLDSLYPFLNQPK